MNFRAEIDIMPLKSLFDPQGKTLANSMKNMGIRDIIDVKTGKHITINLDADNEESAREKVEAACNKILANPVMEYYEYKLFSD